jgi:hypothetical protein
LQLKSGDSIEETRTVGRRSSNQNARWAHYWQQEHVLLVIRTSDSEIRWMDVALT